jgi:hypothetical protein
MLLRIWKVHNGYASEISTDWHVGEHTAKTLQRRVDEHAFSTSRSAPPFVVFERWESMLRAGVRALRGAEAPLFHGTAFVLLVLRKIQDQRQRRRAGVSDPHWLSWVPEDSHRFIFFDVQVTLLPVLGWGYWI